MFEARLDSGMWLVARVVLCSRRVSGLKLWDRPPRASVTSNIERDLADCDCNSEDQREHKKLTAGLEQASFEIFINMVWPSAVGNA